MQLWWALLLLAEVPLFYVINIYDVRVRKTEKQWNTENERSKFILCSRKRHRHLRQKTNDRFKLMQLNTEALMNKWTHWQSWEKHTHTFPFTIASSFCQQPASNQCWFIYRHHQDESIKSTWAHTNTWTSPINIKSTACLCYCTFKTRSACHSICKWARFWLVVKELWKQ